MSFALNGERIAVAGLRGLVDISTGRVLRLSPAPSAPTRPGGQPCGRVAVDRSGTTVAVGGKGSMGMYDARSGRSIMALPGGDPVGFSSDGRTLLYKSGTEEPRGVVLVDVSSRRRLAASREYYDDDGVEATIDSRGRLVALVSGKVVRRDVSVHAVKDSACARAGRTLTRWEWKTLVGETVPYAPPCPG
jgi:hypothetical protein